MEEDWELLELSGPVKCHDLHLESDTLVYGLGPVVVAWDIQADRKVNLRCHEGPVCVVVFAPGQDFLVTAEVAVQPVLCVWKWQTFEQVTTKWLPFKARKRPPTSLQAAFHRNVFFVLENENGGGYRVTLWDWRAPDLILLQVDELEMHATASYSEVLSDGVSFVTVESQVLKLWKIETPYSCSKRLHFKAEIGSFSYSAHNSVFVILLVNGQLLAINREGRVLRTLSHQRLTFATVSVQQDALYVGSTDGSVLVYSLTSFHQIRELTGFHAGELRCLRVNHGVSMYAFYKDATVQVIDLQKNALINQHSGHSCRINSTRWLEKWSFASCSDEGFLYHWKYIGKGWNMKALDVSGRVDRSKVTALAVHPNKSVVACGFSGGSLKFFDLSSETPKFLQSVVLSVLPVVDLKYSVSGQYLGVSYSSGQCLLLDSHSRDVLFHIQEHLMPTDSLPQSVDFLEASRTETPGSYYLKTLTLHSKSSVSLQTLAIWDRSVTLESSHVVEVPGRCTGFTFHVSGSYVFATTDSGYVYLFTSEGELRGAIEVERGATGCLIDPSGLYISVLLPDAGLSLSRLVFYEAGTGRRAAELTRIEGCSSSQALEFSKDGRFLIAGGQLGTLSVWRLPGSLSKNILTMLENLQANPRFWDSFPIDLPSSKVQPKQPEFAEMPPPGSEVEVRVVEPNEVRRSRGTFADSVVSFVKKPRAEGSEPELYPRKSIKPETTRSTDQPFWISKPKQPLQLASGVYTSDPNFSKQAYAPEPITWKRPRAPVSTISKPSVVKASRRFAEPDDIDIHLDESGRGASERSQYDEVEEMYREMDLFP